MYWIGDKMRQYQNYKYCIEIYKVEGDGRLLEKHKYSIYASLHLCLEHAKYEAIDHARNLQEDMCLDDETRVKEDVTENSVALRFVEEVYKIKYVCDITVELDNEEIYFKIF